jgi:hypothetical protein
MKLKRKAKYPGIGVQLFRIRKTLDLTMRDISLKSKVPKDSITDFEQGCQALRSFLQKIAARYCQRSRRNITVH